jgi:PAS domain S-box-containing protein
VRRLTTILQSSNECNRCLSYDEISAVIEQSYDGMLVIDDRAMVVLVNDSYCRIMNINKESILLRSFKDFWLTRPFSAAVLDALKLKKSITRTHYDMVPGKVIMMTANPIFDQEGTVRLVVGNCRDMSELAKLRKQLEKAQEDSESTGPIAVSDKMKNLLISAQKVSSVDITVLITGESGVGKEVVAQYIHDHSLRKAAPFVAVNCGAIPENLLESEFFGYTDGAFTGANRAGKKGLFETANGGTLFLDEIGDLPFDLQVKLLRVLDTGKMTKVGDSNSTPVDVRILAATNKNMDVMVKNHKFREDLYYRLNVIDLYIPPIRDRPEDIRPLCIYFLNKCNQRYGQNKQINVDVLKILEQYDWPGNVRQLRHAIERMVVLSNDDYLELSSLPPEIHSLSNFSGLDDLKETIVINRFISIPEAIAEVEKKILGSAMKSYSSSRAIAKITGIDQTTVLRKIKKYGL